jgi:hypothetical protein
MPVEHLTHSLVAKDSLSCSQGVAMISQLLSMSERAPLLFAVFQYAQSPTGYSA